MSEPQVKQTSKPNARHQSRIIAMQAFYQWRFVQQEMNEYLEEFFQENDLRHVDKKYLKNLAFGTVENIEKIDSSMTPYLDRDIKELNPVELAILRIAVYEFMFRLDVPYKVVINEALEIAKEYGAEDGYKYINGVLDALVPALRGAEASRKVGKKA